MAGRARILVIDDDPDFVEVIRVTLERGGYEVIAADDGAGGLQMAREHKPDLVVLDLLMSPVDGLTLCETMKSDPRFSATPILVLTALQEKMHLGPYSPEISSRLQADDYLDKPIDPGVLVEHVETLLAETGKAQ